jgi:NADPH:quinone reductase-like Zn-dependent oxidoreductase
MKNTPLTAAIGILYCAGLCATATASSLPTTTREVVMMTDHDGRPAWTLVQAPIPSIGDHDVLVRMHAVALERADLDLIEGGVGPEHAREGMICCSDGAGEVVAVGRLVKSVHIGERVTSLFFGNWIDGPLTREKQAKTRGISENGVLGEYVILEDTGVAPIPSGFSYEEAAALPTSGVTAWMATVGGTPISKHSIVLIEGTGGVSTFAMQFAIASGARVVVTSSSDDKLRRVRELGASDGINYKTAPNWADKVLEITQGHGADLVVDIGGKSTIEQSIKSVAYEGTVDLLGGLGGYAYNVPALMVIIKAAHLTGIFAGSRADYLRMVSFMKAHQIRPVVERTYALDDYQTAFKDLAHGNFMGKLVIRL